MLTTGDRSQHSAERHRCVAEDRARSVRSTQAREREKDKYRSLLRELLDAQRNRKSEQLSKDQLDLFETLWKSAHPEEENDAEPPAEEEPKPEEPQTKKRVGRQPLARHLVRERVVHDLA